MCSRQSSVYKKGNGVFLPETGLLNSIHYFSNSPWIKELYLFNIYNRKCSIYNVAIEFSIYNFDTRLGYILFIFPHWFGSSIFPEFSLWSMYCTVLYCTVLYCTVLYCTVLYCTVLYCTVPVLDSVWHDDTASSIIKLCRCRQSKVFNADKNVFIIHQLIVNTGIFNQKDVSQFQKLVSVIEIIYLL